MRHGSLFSGIGGFDLAAQWMGWENVFQVEWDEWCSKVLAKNFPDTLRFGDIVEFNKMLQNGEIITDTEKSRINRINGDNKCQKEKDGMRASEFNCNGQSGIRLGRIDILIGGFPCQPFSHAGKRKGTDDERYLWPEMLTTIRILKPSFVVGENVAGLVSMENGKTLDTILSDLEDEGYTIESFIIPACAVGAWHRRDRIWIIGYRYDANSTSNGITGQDGESNKTKREGIAINDQIRRGQFKTIQHERLDDLPQYASDTEVKRQSSQSDRTAVIQSQEGQGLLCGSSDADRIQSNGEYWAVEPSVGRVANGIPNRVDRLKGLGNAIVPQVAYEIFKSIEAVENFSTLNLHPEKK
jgi:DNA (cytosine-5)-methyltransferase 1